MNGRAVAHDPEWIRLVRRRDIIEHRMSELQGLMEGRRIAREPDHGLRSVAEWLNTEETLWETWPASRIREVLAPCLQEDWDDTNHRKVKTIEGALAKFEGPLKDEVKSWADAPDAPWDEDATIEFKDRRMVFSGVFKSCERLNAEEASANLGAQIRSAVARVTDYLVVGSRCQPGWKHKRRGRKIEQIVRWRETGETQCAIVSEEQWADAVIETVNRERERWNEPEGKGAGEG